ncbi:MAG: methyltransferase domain-containing protein [Desulfobacteraceae bacterium]|jgi:SAM-dependent methyltransferase
METDIQSIDWSAAWAEVQTRNRAKRPYCDPSFWNKRARNFADHQSGKNDYPRQFVDRLHLDPGWSVLDVGCGPGTLALLLADQVRKVTALDFSENMLSILKQRTDEAGVNNIKPFLANIDDNWDELGIMQHDLVIASRSMSTRDLEGILSKLTRFARKKVVVSTMVGKGPRDHRIMAAAGRAQEPGPDYIYVINQLYRMGIYAELGFIVQNIERSYESHDDALEDCRWMIDNMTGEEDDRLRHFFRENLEQRDGRWFLTGSEPIRWAVISWDT